MGRRNFTDCDLECCQHLEPGSQLRKCENLPFYRWGNTFPFVLAASTPNDGAETLVSPNLSTTTARVKVEAVGNIFFDTSNAAFTITQTAYFGFHDGAGCNTIQGWVWDANSPNSTVNVDIYDGSTLIGTVAATLYRQDLADVFGSPYHGFIFHTPPSLRDGQPHTVTVRFGGTNTNLQLDTPRITACTSSTPNYQGSHDAADCNFISGYAWDTNDNEGTINVAIYVDGNFLVVPCQQLYPVSGAVFTGLSMRFQQA